MDIVVFGANGPTGRQVVEQAGAEGHTVTAVTRRPGGFPLEGPWLRVVEGDVYDPFAVEGVVAGQDAVISALGVPYSKEEVTVYSAGITHITEAMAKHGVGRLVAVTSTVLFGTPAPGENFLFRRVLEPALMRFMGRTVYEDMRRMEEIVRETDLDWTVLRPGGLFDAPAVSDYEVGTSRLPGRYTARADLAHELLRQAADDRHARAYVDVRTTQNTPSFLDLIRKEAVGGKEK
ncbi:NAD(P)-dependent oxidoreductase [Streptomyces fulvoviolaceus]|uniref:NAD(P)-dependent oxidoreductase n=1 Tax=Streptomyces fulvoviolaceus TaxID=285535 RepID=UPI0004C66A72|nr:SDR family oxidoreductase [Streptomyces fulvoviolaceus]MCT9080019.1 SDR family oxidoreductase [Streptomyces fulvoviolaceus]